MALARVVVHVLARVLPHMLAHVLLHVLARVIIHVHDYYLKTCAREGLRRCDAQDLTLPIGGKLTSGAPLGLAGLRQPPPEGLQIKCMIRMEVSIILRVKQ